MIQFSNHVSSPTTRARNSYALQLNSSLSSGKMARMWPRMKRTFIEYQLPIYSGLLIGTSFVPFPPWAAFFCYIPLWIYCFRQEKISRVFFASWITQFILTAIGFHWIAHTAHEFGQLPWSVSIFILLSFCCFNNLFVAAATCASRLIANLSGNPKHLYFLLPLSTVLAEYFLAGIFPWNFGYS